MDIIQIPTTQTPGAGLGDVVGPASATDNAIVRYDATTGRLLQNSTVTIADSTGAIAGASSLTSPAATALTLGTGTSGTAITVLSADNYVGIGTTSPSSMLHVKGTSVAGTLRISGDSASSAAILSLSDASAGVGWNIRMVDYVGTGNLVISRGSTAGLGTDLFTIAENNGDVSIASTTAGSANAGALVIAGGISAGNSSVASYFGGAATFAGTVTVSGGSALVQSGTADPFIHIKVTTDNAYNPYLHLEGYNRSFYVGVRDTGVDGLFSIASTSNLLSPLFSISAASPFTATFAGAVSITGNIGFYGQAATAKPTGVLVTAAAIHAALVTLNLIAA